MSEEEQVPVGEEPGDETQAPPSAEVELAEAKAQAEDYLRNWQRAQADFLNYKRRMEQERAELEQFAGAEAIKAVLPVLDDFDRALNAMPANGAAEGSWAWGIAQIARKLQNALSQQGLSPIEAVGKDFDPAEHEAVAQMEAEPEMEGKVTAEARRGYRLRGRVLRPAQVVVGRSA
jgi:molecular chaperone GrpE